MPFIDEREAAKFLRIAPKTLSRWRWAQKGPRYYKIGGAVRYAVADLEEFARQVLPNSRGSQ